MRRDLIDLSESYIREEKFFNDPKQLEEIFNK